MDFNVNENKKQKEINDSKRGHTIIAYKPHNLSLDLVIHSRPASVLLFFLGLGLELDQQYQCKHSHKPIDIHSKPTRLPEQELRKTWHCNKNRRLFHHLTTVDSETPNLFDCKGYSANDDEGFGGNSDWIGVLGFAILTSVEWFCTKTTSFQFECLHVYRYGENPNRAWKMPACRKLSVIWLPALPTRTERSLDRWSDRRITEADQKIGPPHGTSF